MRSVVVLGLQEESWILVNLRWEEVRRPKKIENAEIHGGALNW